MSELTPDLIQGGSTAQLQLLILQCLSSVLNHTQKASLRLDDSEKFNSTYIVQINIDKALLEDDTNGRLLDIEDKLNTVLEFQRNILDEVSNSFLKSENILPEIIQNINNRSCINPELLTTCIRENTELVKKNEELQINYELLQKNSIEIQKKLVEENKSILETNKNLIGSLLNMTYKKDKLEDTVKELGIKLMNQTLHSLNIEKNILYKESVVLEMEAKLNETLQRCEEWAVNKDLSDTQQEARIISSTTDYCATTGHFYHWTERMSTNGNYSWKPDDIAILRGVMEIKYSSSMDTYYENDLIRVEGWSNGVFNTENLTRVIESDYNKAYLSRDNDSPLETRDFEGVSQLVIVANLSKGKGDAN
ncbi:hypothetical protein C0J52_22206 [Blattella germanica]|nr:hypothetical protein C0J52_22206 [Blattella germanica]